VVAGLVDTRGLAFVLALLLAIAQLLMVFAFQNTRTAGMERPLTDENR
jgi:hypothetical protein